MNKIQVQKQVSSKYTKYIRFPHDIQQSRRGEVSENSIKHSQWDFQSETLTEQFNTNTDRIFKARHGQDIHCQGRGKGHQFNHQNNDLGKGTTRSEVDARDAAAFIEVAILWPKRGQQRRHLPVVAGRATGCDVDKLCAKGVVSKGL